MAELNYQDELAPERTQAEFEIEEVEIKPCGAAPGFTDFRLVDAQRRIALSCGLRSVFSTAWRLANCRHHDRGLCLYGMGGGGDWQSREAMKSGSMPVPPDAADTPAPQQPAPPAAP